KPRPLKVNSPVIAVSHLIRLRLKRETKDVTRVTPAEGPSFGTAPAGKCICTSRPSSKLLSVEAKLSYAALALTCGNVHSQKKHCAVFCIINMENVVMNHLKCDLDLYIVLSIKAILCSYTPY
ncbi:hypothetical protein Tco_0081462, partial [Tanacetum coccineum]